MQYKNYMYIMLQVFNNKRSFVLFITIHKGPPYATAKQVIDKCSCHTIDTKNEREFIKVNIEVRIADLHYRVNSTSII